MAEAGTFWGLIGIALSILALGIPYFLVCWRRTTRFEEMADFLKRLMLVQIDEKVAMMDGYISEIPDWKKDGKSPDYVNAITDKINSDLKSVYRIKNEINQDQIIELKYRGKKLVNLMRNEQYDTSRIEAVLELFD
jgi:hypothetical protein